MFGPGRHFPPAELREWERGERLDPEYQLSAKPPSFIQPSLSPRPRPRKVRVGFTKNRERGKKWKERWRRMREEEGGKDGQTDRRRGSGEGVSQRCKWAKYLRHPSLSSRVVQLRHSGLGVETQNKSDEWRFHAVN